MHVHSLPFFDVEFPLNNDNEMKRLAKMVAKQLRPHWNLQNVSIEVFTAGITNKVFCAIHEPNQGSSEDERMIFRVYGKNTEKIIDRKGELENWLRLAAVGCAAPLYATFINGIICGYLPGKSLSVDTVRDKNIYPRICKAMSRIHRIRPDYSRKPSLFKHIEKFIDNFSEQFSNEDMQKRFDNFAIKRGLSLQSDYMKLKKIIENLDNEIVFCHNDLLIHNIVYDKITDKISFIDYEYADFNYQCFDIANHFNEFAGVENVDYSLCPDEDEKHDWIEKYLEYYLRRKPLEIEVQAKLRQIAIFEAASHFLWSIWALVQSQNSTIDFDYLGYAMTRYEMFEERRNEYLRLHPEDDDTGPVIVTHDECDFSISVH